MTGGLPADQLAYSWVDGDEPYVREMCLTLVRGLRGEDLVAALPIVVARGPMSAAAADDWAFGDHAGGDVGTYFEPVYAGTEGEWGWVWAVNGFAGVDPEVAARLSRGTEYVGYYFSVNADMSLLYAKDGVVTRRFDPLLDAGGVTEFSGPVLAQEIGLVWDSPRAASFALVTRITGVDMSSPDWVRDATESAFVERF